MINGIDISMIHLIPVNIDGLSIFFSTKKKIEFNGLELVRNEINDLYVEFVKTEKALQNSEIPDVLRYYNSELLIERLFISKHEFNKALEKDTGEASLYFFIMSFFYYYTTIPDWKRFFMLYPEISINKEALKDVFLNSRLSKIFQINAYEYFKPLVIYSGSDDMNEYYLLDDELTYEVMSQLQNHSLVSGDIQLGNILNYFKRQEYKLLIKKVTS